MVDPGAAMRFATCLTGVLALAAVAHAQAPSKPPTFQEVRQILEDREYWRQQDERYNFIELRARALYPGRRDTPLRDLNISDNEIREVETIARKYLPQLVRQHLSRGGRMSLRRGAHVHGAGVRGRDHAHQLARPAVVAH